MSGLFIGHCYKIAGHRPIVVTHYDVIFGVERKGPFDQASHILSREPGYIYVEGYTPRRYQMKEKFYLIAKDDPGCRTVAEVEGIEEPPVTTFRFRLGSKIEEVKL